MSCDDEIHQLQQQLVDEKNNMVHETASEVMLKANDLQMLANIFIDCVHS